MSLTSFEEMVQETASVVLQGKIILYPTDTIWGIGCDASNEKSINKIYKIKNRPTNKSFIILLADIEQLEKYVLLNDTIIDFLYTHTTPTTIIYNQIKKRLPQILYASDGSIAIRLVKDNFCQALIHKIKVPLLSTSANNSGDMSPFHFKNISMDIKNKVDWIVPAKMDMANIKKPSQIIRFLPNGEIEYLRK